MTFSTLFTLFVVALQAVASLHLDTLVLYQNKEDLRIAKVYFEGLGTPSEEHKSLPDLYDDNGVGKYYGIVMTYQLNGADLDTVREYAKENDVRLVFLQSSPDKVSGVTSKVAPTQMLKFNDLIYADIMCQTCTWPVTNGKFRTKPAAVINETNIDTVMNFVDKEGLESSAAVVVQKFPIEEMHFFFKATINEMDDKGNQYHVQRGQYTKTNMALANVWFMWMNRGTFIGRRRVLLQMHIDDWFASTQLYDNDSLRIGSADVDFALEHSRKLNMRLPEGSTVKFEPAYNAAGMYSINYKKNYGLGDASQKHRDAFNWLSHTFTHQNVDWLEPFECDTGLEDDCRTSASRMYDELDFNDRVIRGQGVSAEELDKNFNGFLETPSGLFFADEPEKLDTFYSPKSLVTPEISGLWPKSKKAPPNRVPKAFPGNFQNMKVLSDFGVEYVTGDNSRSELVSKTSVHHGVKTTIKEYGVDDILIIPRWSPSVFYNTHNSKLYSQMYNEINACMWSTGVACKKNTTYSFHAIMQRQARATTIPWLQFRADPFMFHQANMHAFMHKGKKMSLVGEWASQSLNELEKYIRVPILSPRMDEVGEMFADRMKSDDCEVKGILDKSSPEGHVITLSTNKKDHGGCRGHLTFSAEMGPIGISSQPTPENTVTYGDDLTFSFDLTTNEADSPKITVESA